MKAAYSKHNSVLVVLIMVFLLAACNTGSTPVPLVSTETSQDTPVVEIQDAPKPQSDALELQTVTPEGQITEASLDVIQDTSDSFGDWDDREAFRAGLIESAQWALDDLAGGSVYHIDVQISDDKLGLEGHQAVRYTNRESTDLDEVYFQLFPNATGGGSEVLNVSVDGVPVDIVYHPDRFSFQVPLGQSLEPGESIVIEMDFVVDIPAEMAGTYGTFGYFNDILVLDEFYPVIPVFDQDGWHNQVPAIGDLTYLDASFYQVQVTAPGELVLVASGIEAKHQESGSQKTVTYIAGPARDFYLAGSDQYDVVSREVGDTTVNSYAINSRMEGAEYALNIAEDSLRIFNRRFGNYPYVEMDIVSIPMSALGIEYPGIMGVTLDAYDMDGELLGLPNPVMLESTVAHEVGHQWFYNVVGNNQVGDAWLDEAVVQYITGLYHLDRYGTSGYNGLRNNWISRWERVERADIPIGMPSESYAPIEYSAIVYGRGPLFIEALADEMGEETFNAFMQDYYQTNQWGISSGEGFKAAAEEFCECDLTYLFDEWVW